MVLQIGRCDGTGSGCWFRTVGTLSKDFLDINSDWREILILVQIWYVSYTLL